MLPFSLLVGFVAGLVVVDRPGVQRGLVLGALVSLAFALMVVGGQGRSITSVVALFGLAAGNHVVGLVFGSGIRGGAELMARGWRAVS